jgi:hypothetical protein
MDNYTLTLRRLMNAEQELKSVLASIYEQKGNPVQYSALSRFTERTSEALQAIRLALLMAETMESDFNN